MFERYTDRARKVMGFSRKAAERLRHEYIGTKHLLLALLGAVDFPGAVVLTDLGAEREAVRSEILKRIRDKSDKDD